MADFSIGLHAVAQLPFANLSNKAQRIQQGQTPKPQNKWFQNCIFVKALDGVADMLFPRNPVTKKREIHLMPESIEVALGRHSYLPLIEGQGGECTYAAHKQFLHVIGKRIASVSDRPTLPYEFKLIDSQVLNAWCLPGGFIGFNNGLLRALDREKGDLGVGYFSLEEKVAAVISHEIIHAAARHSAKRVEFGLFLTCVLYVAQAALRCLMTGTRFTRSGRETAEQVKRRQDLGTAVHRLSLVFNACYHSIYGLLISSHSRQGELEADQYGMVYMKRAGYDPRAAIWLQKFLARGRKEADLHWLSNHSSHPTSAMRVAENEKTLDLLNRGLLT